MRKNEQCAQAARLKVLDALANVNKCTSQIISTTKQLLSPVEVSGDVVSKTKNRSDLAKVKAKTVKSATATPISSDKVLEESLDQLTAQERKAFAVELVNKGLQVITETKSSSTTSNHGKTSAKLGLEAQRQDKVKPKASSRLKEISINKIPSTTRTSKLTTTKVRPQLLENEDESDPVIVIAICTSLAFDYLRDERAAAVKQDPPTDYKLEHGMLALAGRLLALRYISLAIAELQALKDALQLRCNRQTTIVSGKSYVTDHPLLANLLVFSPVPADEPCLKLVINYQILVLRIILQQGNPNAIGSVSSFVRMDSTSSPVHLLLQYSKTGQNAEEAARLLETLSQLLFSLCPGLSQAQDEVAQDPKKSPPPACCLELQTTAIQAQVGWMTIARHQGDADVEIWKPFLRCIKACGRRAMKDFAATYNITQACIKALLHSIQERAPMTMSPSEAVNTELNSHMSKLAQHAGLAEEALNCLSANVTTTKHVETSSLNKAILIARVVGLRLVSPATSSSDHSSQVTLEDLLAALLGIPEGTAQDDLKAVLFEMLQLGQKILPIIKALAQHKDKQAGCLTIDISDCFRTFHAIICFFLRLLALDKGSSSSTLTEKMVVQIHMSVRTIVFCSSSEFLASSIDFEVHYQALQDSLRLCECAGVVESSAASAPESLSTNDALVVAISNAYWTFVSRFKTNADHSLRMKCMKASVACLEHRRPAMITAGRLMSKLIRLAQAQQDINKHTEARDAFVSAISEAARCGVLETAAIAANISDKNSTWEASDEARHMAQALDLLLQLDAIEHIGLPNELPYFDMPQLDVSCRCILLEKQLSLTKQWGSSRRLKVRADQLRQAILPLLLKLYDSTLFPIRHRGTACLILRDAIMQPGSTDEETIACAASCGEELPADLQHDGQLETDCIHVSATLTVLRALFHNTNVASVTRAPISDWTSVLKSCATLPELTKKINDVAAWIDLLGMLAEHLHLDGHHKLELQTLCISLRVHEIGYESGSMAVSVMRLSVAQLLLQMGYASEAGVLLNKARDDLTSSSTEPNVQVDYYCNLALYYMALGNFEQSLAQVAKADDRYAQASAGRDQQLSRKQKVVNIVRQAKLLSIRAGLLWVTESQREALHLQTQSVILLQRIWKSLEATVDEPTPANDATSSSLSVDRALSKLTLATTKDQSQQQRNPLFGRLAPDLCAGLLQLSQMVYWSGLYEDALYYVEQALQTAQYVASKALEGAALVRCGELRSRGGDLIDGHLSLKQADTIYASQNEEIEVVAHKISLGLFHHFKQEWSIELKVYERASKLVDHLYTNNDILTKWSFTTEISKTATTTEVKDKVAKRGPASQHNSRLVKKAESKPANTCNVVSLQFRITKDRLLHSSTEALLAQGDLEDAAALFPLFSTDNFDTDLQVQQNSTIARKLLLDGQLQVSAHPALSTLSESVISLPSAVRPRRRGSSLINNRVVPPEGSPKKHSKKGALTVRTKDTTAAASVQTSSCGSVFVQAYEAAFPTAAKTSQLCSVTTIGRAAATGTTSALLTSFAFPGSSKIDIHPAQLAWFLELPRTLASLRERDYVDCEARKSDRDAVKNDLDSRNTASTEKDLSLSGFQANFIDIIPENWSAISMGLDEQCEHLHVVRYEAHRKPFTIRMPLNRQTVEDPEEETFSFEDAVTELRTIIQDSDGTVHAARDDIDSMKQKGAKTKWWAAREALNDRLRDLLLNIENMWFGGFRGIFSQHQRDTDLLARFQQTFENILDKHLPSRQRLQKFIQESKVKLDIHVMDLFVGLTHSSHASPSDLDVEEALTDLLYYVVDILQFNGEANAYDEIDFDSVVVQIIDALQSYHEAAASRSQQQSQHTILILDKTLHAFPWECLPCLEGHSVSRLSSLYDLRERVLAMRAEPEAKEPGFHISGARGTYILNPSGDLTKTQSRFEKPLSALAKWDNIINRPPTEDEFLGALEHTSSTTDTSAPDKSLLLYFGHGSGAQYVRSRRIKRLRTLDHPHTPDQPPYPTCNTALLFGCSSASLREASEFEPYGTPKTYLAAGAPALLGSLWDVTDGDCDAFAAGVLERWGMLETGSCKVESGKGRKAKAAKGKAASKDVDMRGSGNDGRKLCLSEAVAKSRGDCYLKYLNGAAMVVYGVPVFLTR